MEESEKWTWPQKVDDVLLAFPAHVIGTLMPEMDEIPEEFHRSTEASRKWRQLQNDWFMKGLQNPEFYCKEGVDGETAVRHLQACQGSFQPQHEHKMTAVAYLASLWFDDVKYEGRDDGTHSVV